MRLKRIWIVATAALVVLVGALGLALAQSGGAAEVRINAQRLEDGRTAFALQQRIDGEWGERIEPRVNKMPADPGHGRWLNSSPVTIETQAATSSDGDSADEDSGASSEELAAAQAALAAAQTAQQTAEAEAAEAKAALETAQQALTESEASLAESVAALAEATAPPMIVRELGTMNYDDGRITTTIETENWHGIATVLSTRIALQADGEYGLSDVPVVMELVCREGHRTVEFYNLPVDPTEDEWGNLVHSVSYRITPTPEGEPAVVRGYRFDARDNWRGDRYIVDPLENNKFYLNIRQADSLEISFTGKNDRVSEVSFSLDGLFDTAAQDNIDHCSDYY